MYVCIYIYIYVWCVSIWLVVCYISSTISHLGKAGPPLAERSRNNDNDNTTTTNNNNVIMIMIIIKP